MTEYNMDKIKKIITLFIPALIILTIGLLMISCGTIKEVPVQTIEKIVYKDSIIYINDSIKVEIPKETIREVIPEIDTSYIKTSIAESIAYIDTTERKLIHTLTQKGELNIKYDTIIKIQNVDRIIEKEVPVEVEIVKYKRDALFWALAIWALICLLIVGCKIFIFK